jgi:TonB family protein
VAAVGFRRRLQTGPALRIAPLPVASLTLSTLLHVALIVAAVIAVNAIKESQPKIYTINLVPAVPAIGRPDARPAGTAPPTARPEPPRAPAPRPEVPPAPRAEIPPAPRPELPTRPSPPPELPARERPREAVGLPDRVLPPRSAAPAPRQPQQKELPSVASPAPPPRVATPAPATPAPTTPAREVPAAATAPVGLPTGSAQGKGKLSVETNFPYAWYVKILHDKITERWDPYAMPGQQPLISFEIGRNGTVDPGKISVAQSSGNRNYDKLAMRAIAEAGPFPPLPDEFKDQRVTVNIQFRFEAGRS